jgi:hypothetical protein
MKEDDIVVFDVESNGLLDKVSKVWVIAATNLDGTKKWIFTDQYMENHKADGSLIQGVRWLVSRKMIVCHNIAGYDYHVFEKFWPTIWNRNTVPFKKMWDTFVQSKCQHFDRPKIKGVRSNHSLEYYGVMFKYPKPPIEDWSYWDEEKLNRVLVDIEINRKTFHWLNNEAEKTGLDFKTQVRRTQASQYWYTVQELKGTCGNKRLMELYVDELDNEIESLRREVEPHLPPKVKPKAAKITWQDMSKFDWFFDKVPLPKRDDKGRIIKESYQPTHKIFTKAGAYTKSVYSYFEISPDPEDSKHFSVGGPFTRIEIVDSKMSQHAIIKEFLLSQGWKPTQWNYEKNTDGSLKKDESNNLIKKSPKLTEDSFDSIKGDIGNKIARYNTLVHRRRTFKNEKDDKKGWLNQLRDDGRISAGAMAWQTGTGRAAQFGIVNVPSASAVYGAPMREVWQAPEDHVLVSVDMDSAQMRLLANYMGDDEYTKAVMEGEEFDSDHRYVGTDAHTLNAKAFGTLPDELWEEARLTQDPDLIAQCSSIRKTGKNGFYALLFGAGDVKLANTLKVKGGANAGAKIKNSFRKKLKKAGDLQDRLLKQWKSNSFRRGGYIEVCGNTWVWCPSEHKLLNYLLMGSEAVLQNQAIVWANAEARRRGLKGSQILAVHDEITFEFPSNEKEEGVALLTEMYSKASKTCGLDVIVSGTAQAGKTWLDIH